MNIVKQHDSVTPEIKNIIRSFSVSGRRRLLQSAGSEFLRQTRANFGTNGQYRDKPWKPLSASYAKKIGSNTATLKRSGNLYNSIKMNAPRRDSVQIYSRSKYAAAQTFGYKPRKLPARNFWPVQFSTPNYSRLLANSERDMMKVISRELQLLSAGSLPPLNINSKRSSYQYGNVFQI